MGKTLAYLIPILILLSILYVNFLPLGYSDSRTIDIGSSDDTSGIFSLEGSDFLGGREERDNDSTFRTLDGLVYATYTPKVILRDSMVDISLLGEDVYMNQQPKIDFEWDFEWTGEEFFKNFDIYNINEDKEIEKTNRKPRIYNNCVNLDGRTRLELPRTVNRFQEGPFAIYVEWIPKDDADHQQIIGHFNWEIYQNKRDVNFSIVGTTDGNRYSVSYDIDNNFFNQKNSLLALYNPANSKNEVGFIELFVNGFSTGKEYIYDSEIDKNYGNQNLTLGWTVHSGGERPGFVGEVCNARFSYIELEGTETKEASFETKIAQTIRIPIVGEGILKKIELKIEK